ncbi:hypothetical protein Leryth_019616 [Lithospermum erythrorhizon]|uniref:F-box domain-containing protein n=1 Tax=Lithospermum erythrorhizon TaxID=34254 RepID=A0AAV3R2J1_LITER|nr:hypothetical protein Leryth_019616 [Lithospermum erythrorhizon]
MTSGMISNEGYGYELVRNTSFGRKRVALRNVTVDFGVDELPLKRQCSLDSFVFAEKSPLESLPEDLLVRVLCGVNHEDLKSLYYVSKSIKEAAMVAKKLHFEFSTPRKTVGFRSVADNEWLSGLSDVEAPNAPKQSRRRSELNRKKLSDISVALFASDD